MSSIPQGSGVQPQHGVSEPFQPNSGLEGVNCFHTTWRLSHKPLHRTLLWNVWAPRTQSRGRPGHTVRHTSAGSCDSAPPTASSKRLDCLGAGQHRHRQPASLDPCCCSAEWLEPHRAFKVVLWHLYEQARAHYQSVLPLKPVSLMRIGMCVGEYIPSLNYHMQRSRFPVVPLWL